MSTTTQTHLTPFTAAEIAYDRALESDEVKGAQKLESVLGGNGEYTADVAHRVWREVMAELGFAEYAQDDDADEDES